MLLSQSNPKLGSLASLASLKRKKETVQVSEFLQISKLSLGKQFDQDFMWETRCQFSYKHYCTLSLRTVLEYVDNEEQKKVLLSLK